MDDPDTIYWAVKSRSSGTLKQYARHIREWETFCENRKEDSVFTNQNAVAVFCAKSARNYGYSVVNTARSAVAAVAVMTDGNSAGSSPLVSRVLKGVFKVKPSLPRYNDTWDVRIMLDQLRSMPMSSLDLKRLTQKVAAMLVLFSGQRAATIASLEFEGCHLVLDKCEFPITALQKTSKIGNHLKKICFDMFDEEPALCVVSHITRYLDMTNDFRDASRHGAFLMSFVKPHGAVSVDTVRRWIRGIMTEAGIDCAKFKPHSMRAASTSSALKVNPIDEIMGAVGWSSEATVAKHYHKLVKFNFGKSVVAGAYDL